MAMVTRRALSSLFFIHSSNPLSHFGKTNCWFILLKNSIKGDEAIITKNATTKKTS
jgi:hypothetical protein